MNWLQENRLLRPARSKRWPPSCAKNRHRWTKKCRRRCAGSSTAAFKRSRNSGMNPLAISTRNCATSATTYPRRIRAGPSLPLSLPTKRRRWKLPALCAACMLFAGLLVYLLNPSGQNIGNYRYTPFAADTSGKAIWSPDGKAVAYAGKVNGTYQVFLRYLNSPVPVQLTHEKLDTVPVRMVER